jgi:hypothetical protein
MKNIVRRLGLLMLMTAAFTVAGHIYEHCTAATAGSFVACSLCNDIQGTSVDAAPQVDAALVLLFVEPFRLHAGVSAEILLSEISRAPPGALLS